ncbi:FliO/MopB family protein [Spongorhabdus nitratireducens]
MSYLIRQGCQLVTFFLSYWVVMVAVANEATEASSDVVENTGTDLELGNSLLAMGASLLIVIALIFAMAWLAKRFNLHQPGSAIKGPIKILAMKPLTNQVRVCIIEAGNVQLLISLSGQNATTLHVFDEPVIDSNAPVSETAANNILANTLRKKT